MIIYEAEKKDGLEMILSSSASLVFDCEIKTDNQIAIASIEDPDLFYIESTYTSVGWNSNDDVFDKFEMWRARNTPTHKKFNYMHNENDIIGHITQAYVIDKDKKLISDDTREEDLPEFFEIAVGSVIYRKWQDSKAQARINTLLAEIIDNKWFVSMEVLFPDFDYAVSRDNSEQIITRNKETAFLTKHLRAYGGAGEYEGYKIGRKLKGMTFSGKGLVDKPGNKRSLITLVGFNGAQASQNIFKEVNMTVEQKDYDKVVADAGALKQSLEASVAKAEAYKTQVESLTKDLEAAKALSDERNAKIQKLEADFTQSTAKLNETNQTLAQLLDAIKVKERVSQLVNVGVELSKAELVVTKFSAASDEMFAEVVALNTVKKDETSTASKVENAEAALKNVESVKDESKDVNNVETASAALVAKAKASEFLKNHFAKKTK